MAGFTVSTCCCLFDLKTGCLIIGYLNLVIELILFVIGMAGLITGGVMTASSNIENQDLGAGLVSVSIFFLLLLLFTITFTVILLYGVHKRKRGYLRVYLVAVGVLMMLYIFASSVQASREFDGVHFIGECFFYSLNIYFWVVIRSYYSEINNIDPPIYSKA